MSRERVVLELKIWFWFCSSLSIVCLSISLIMVILLASVRYTDLVGFILLVILPFFIGLLAVIPANYASNVLSKKFGEERYG